MGGAARDPARRGRLDALRLLIVRRGRSPGSRLRRAAAAVPAHVFAQSSVMRGGRHAFFTDRPARRADLIDLGRKWRCP
ncbi:hypothetical protein, partial [Burkholderia thailandensis]|uniref:hypothetical protein n=1 Tax=Burkholderia thailandensis TaxID=57975 RepID=UPI001CA5173E